jgi:beta-galactosidase
MDRGWRFALGHATDPSRDFEFTRDRSFVKAGEARGAAGVHFDDSSWRTVDLPHDWAIELPFAEKDNVDEREHAEHGHYAIGPGFPQHSVGWYRRAFDIAASDEGKRIVIEFDGVFRDSVVWVNGHRLGRHASGYDAFRYDITDLLVYGKPDEAHDTSHLPGAVTRPGVQKLTRNVVAVRVDATQYEGWWYEGAGIQRHVWLTKTGPVHVADDGVFVTSSLSGRTATLTINTEVARALRGTGVPPVKSSRARRPSHEIVDVVSQVVAPDGAVVASSVSKRVRVGAGTLNEVVQRVRVRNPQLWHVDHPHLYTLVTTLRDGSTILDRVETTFGIRTLKWDADKGFFLNGRPLKIKGTCNHRDHAGVGAALPDRLHGLRIEKLKELGSNAFRCAHYPHARELLDACDRLGMLVMCENRLASTSPDCVNSFASMIRRDRNHPSVFMWSIGNEEHTIQWSKSGERIGRMLVELAHQLDPTRVVTAAMHDKGLGEGFANVLDVHGWNYMKVGDIEAYRAAKPNQPIVSSEESSVVSTRGEYADDKPRGYVNAYGTKTPGWGMTAQRWWSYSLERPWHAGGFVWTGFDYRGEPIPYRWPCTTSHFGLMDLCGFPKDLYWYYRAMWRADETVLHLFPHWNLSPGQQVTVACFTNCDEVELFVNGHSVGRRPATSAEQPTWSVAYEPGAIEAVGYRGGRVAKRSRVETTGPASRLELIADRRSYRADGEDVASVTVRAVDAEGRFVPTAKIRVEFAIEGAASILGVGNGDPSSHEPEKASSRSLFNGLALVLLQMSDRPGRITLHAKAEFFPSADLQLRAQRATRRPIVG